MRTTNRKSAASGKSALLRVYPIVHAILQPARFLLFGLRRKDTLNLPDEPCLILANHTSFFDPLIIIALSKKPVTFVAGEHLYRNPVIRWFLSKKMNAVSYTKGRQDTKAIYELMKKIRGGQTVCLFGEGNITYDGATTPLPTTVGKLVKVLNRTTVTVQIQGAYMMQPRWSSGFCRGQVQCHVKEVYAPHQFDDLSPKQITRLLNCDLYMEEPAPGGGSRGAYRCSAKGIWHILYSYPVCGKLQTITSKRRSIWCTQCGAAGTWTKYGKIESTDFSFQTLYEWSCWEKTHIRQLAEEIGDIRISSPDVRLIQLLPDHELKIIAQGALSMTRDALCCGAFQFSLKDIVQMDTRNKGVLLFSTRNGGYYEINSARKYPGLLYKTMFEQLR